MRYAYRAIAWIDNRPAGHVCYGRTADECRARAHRKTAVSVVLRRVRVTEQHYEQIASGDQQADSLAHRI